MRMPHSSVIPDYSGGFSELREVTDNIMDPSNPVDVGLMGLGMAPIPGARVPIGLRALSKAAQYILQNGLGKARRLFPKGAIDDAVVELSKRESQIITKANEANKGRKAGYMEDAQAARRNQGRTTRRGMRDKDPDYYLDDYPVEKPLGFAAGGMPRSPLMLPTPVPSQRPPRMFINDDRPRFEGNNPRFNIPAPAPEPTPIGLNPDGTLYVSPLPSAAPGVPTGPDGQIGPANIPEENFNTPERFMGINDRPPMQYIGEGAPIMKMPPEIPQFPGRQPKFPGMMEPIRDPEPVGPPPGMPPLTPMPQTPMSSPVIPQVAPDTRTPEELQAADREWELRLAKLEAERLANPPVPEAVPLSIEEKRNWGRQPTMQERLEKAMREGKFIGPDDPNYPPPIDFVGGRPPGLPKSNYTIAEWYNMSPEEQKAARDEQVGRWWTPPDTILGYNDAPLRVEDIPRLEAMGGHEDLLARLYTIRDQIGAWKSGSPVTPTGPDPTGPGMPTPPGPGMPPTPPGPVASQGTGTSPTPEPPMPPEAFPDEPEQTAQPTQDQFMERLMQMIQALQERSQPVAQPAPQPVQQMPPPPPRPPATPFNMGNTGMSGGAPTMPQMFNQGPGFFTPQQRGPRIAPGAIAQQGQEMPNYNLDFSSFLRNR